MVREKIHCPEMHTTYILKSGQTLENTKPSERLRALIVPKSTFHRFVDYTTETERIAAQQEKEIAKIAEVKKATYEKSKEWDSTIENIKARRREELLSKRRIAEEERMMYVKNMAEKKATERAEIVKQARKLLLQKKPLCRRINRALLASECLRELDAQVAFQKTIKAIDKEQDTEYANLIKLDVAKHEEQKSQEVEKQIKKMQDYRTELQKQIEKNEYENKMKKASEMEIGKQDQENMARDMQLSKEKEMQDILNKKMRLQRSFKEVIEEKKRCEMELKNNEEFEDQAMEIYRKAKDRIEKIHKSVILEEKEEKIRCTQAIEKQHNNTAQIREIQEEEILKKAVKEREEAEAEKRKTDKEREETMRALIEEYKLQYKAAKTKERQKQKDLKTWEMMQRFKREEYNKQTMLEERKKQWHQKLEYRNELQRSIEEKDNEKKLEKILEIEAANIQTIEKANQKILLYGEEILEESKGVRPLYPILKAIEECKKEMGLMPIRKTEEIIEMKKSKRKQGIRRGCTKPVPTDQIYYLQ